MASANTTTSAGADAAGPAPDAVNTPATSGAAAGAGAGAGAGSAAAATVPASASAMEPALHSVAANGITIAYYELLPPASSTSSSAPPPLAVCVHGYPDTAKTWFDFMPQLAAEGYRVVAPHLRGYHPTSAPAGDDYGPITLGRDVCALVSALGYEKAVAIGQDWGAMSVYMACLLEPAKFERAITVAIPHPASLKPSASGLYKARHFMTYKLPWAVWQLSRNNFAHVKAIYKRWSPTWDVPDAELEDVKRCFAEKDGASNALGYYRAFSFSPPADVVALFRSKTRVPTLVVCGLDDGATPPESFQNMARSFKAYFRLASVPGAGHFVHREQPEEFARVALDFLRTPLAELQPLAAEAAISSAHEGNGTAERGGSAESGGGAAAATGTASEAPNDAAVAPAAAEEAQATAGSGPEAGVAP